jgi:hypothetical protein
MRYFLLIFAFTLLLTGCATIGPDGVEVTSDDTVFTVGGAVAAFITIWWAKTWIEYVYACRLEKYKHELENDKKDS